MSDCAIITIRAKCKLPKHPDDDRLYYLDLSPKLTGTDTLDGVTLTVTEDTSFGDLTIDPAPTVLAADTTVNNKQLYASKAITCRISGGTVDSDSEVEGQPKEYRILWTASTTAGDLINVICVLVVTTG